MTSKSRNEKKMFMSDAYNKVADQHARLCSLISGIVVRCIDIIMSIVALSEIRRLLLHSVDVQTGLCRTWSHNTKCKLLFRGSYV